MAISKTLAHLKYIRHRPGPDVEKGGRELFSDSEDRVEAKEARKEIRKIGPQRVIVHKMTLAPEINPADKKAFTREVMANIGQAKGHDLKWYAVAHTNTDHHHVHVVIFGKDKNGVDVRIDRKDLEKAREFGDRYLEREHPREMELAREEKERKKKDRKIQWQRDRQERIRDGLELPWMHKMIVREQLEPYEKWKERRDSREREPEKEEGVLDKDADRKKIEAFGRKWGKHNTLKELRDLDQRLWDKPEERLSDSEQNTLSGWIREKEREDRRQKIESKLDKQDRSKEEREYFEYGGKEYSKKDPLKKLNDLSKELRNNSEKLPYEDYQKLRGWVEEKDRGRFADSIGKWLEQAKQEMKTPERPRSTEPAGGRIINPIQQHMMGNPVVKLFMIQAGAASELVRSIPLVENRDRLKESKRELENASKELDDKIAKDLKGSAYEEKAKGHKENVDKALDESKEAGKKKEQLSAKEKEKKERDEKDREWFERGGGWGR